MENSTKSTFRNVFKSSSFFAIISFLIIVIIIFIILLRLGVAIISKILAPPNNVHLIDGLVTGNSTIVFPQDPAIKNAVTIERSSNEANGIEFSWSVWIYVSSMGDTTKYKNIFTKGNYSAGDSGLNTPNNAPGLYISPTSNELLVLMNTYEVINEEVVVPDIPLNKWLHVVITCSNKTLNVYINGLITKSHNLIGVPKQNYSDVYVALGGGFDGFISNLWYWNHSLQINEIQRLYQKGPNTTLSSLADQGLNGQKNKNGNYLSLNWYFNEL